MIGSPLHLIPKGLDLLFLKEPTHIPSVLDVFIDPGAYEQEHATPSYFCHGSFIDRFIFKVAYYSLIRIQEVYVINEQI